jgi:hypothetical protein
MRRQQALVALAMLALVASSAEALPAKDYRVQESIRCANGQGCPRMLRNARSHAEQFCQAEGGVLKGANRRDFRCEQRGIYCVVSGRIECRGRFDPTHAPTQPGVDPSSPPVDRTRTCLDAECSRFISHPPGLEERGTHVCPYGYLVVGVSGLGNSLVCQELSKPVRKTTVEREVRRQDLLACPPGMVVRGVNEDRDTLLCAELDAEVGPETVQDESDHKGLQVCDEIDPDGPSIRFVTGLDPARTRLMCAPLTPR